MIWDSIFLMTLFDIVIITTSLSLIYICFQHKEQLSEAGQMVPTVIFFIAISLLGLFYAFDFYTMWIMPMFTSKAEAMSAMRDLHLNYSWILNLFVAMGILFGFYLLMQKILESNKKYREINERLENELEQIKIKDQTVHRYQDIVSGTNDMLALVNNEYRYLIVNPAYASVFGKKIDDFVGTIVTEHFTPDFYEHVIKPKTDRCLKGQNINYQEYFEYPAIGKRYMDITYITHYDDNQEINGFIMHGRDITDIKQADDSINELNTAIHHAMQGISHLDTEGKFDMVKADYARMLGYQPEELIGQSWQVTVPEDEHQLAIEACEKMFAEGQSEVECRAIRKDGSIFYKLLLLVLDKDDEGNIVGHYCFMRDITKRKKRKMS